ncbi:MAG: type VI secretion system protein TssA [Candidatus Contendobacter odensis]|uniref:Type VI secretion system protein TssA n=1 Tax=Candidatus Contendibacter odensensis TaxID=1400860 RepID=A0A2G6PF05_9GAMM|nr:MAG: type VI secretion system protein TssA [Candidatus Contendobacter odensis]
MSVIEVENLLEAIDANAPCGEDLEYDPAFTEMDTLAQEKPEQQYGDTIIPAEPPDWRGVRNVALELFGRTHDLRVAVCLSRALLATDGLPGFADGLALIEGLITRYWDEVHPQLDPDDDNDPTLRINTLITLCDPETTLHDLSQTPLVSSRVLGHFSLRDIQVATGTVTPIASASNENQSDQPSQTSIDGAFQDADLEALQAIATATAKSIERIERIEAELTDRVSVTQAPDMSALRTQLKDIQHILAAQLQRRGVSGDVKAYQAMAEAGAPEVAGATMATQHPVVSDITSRESEVAGVTTATQHLVVGDITSREDAIRTLDKICEYFERYEPSSPVPFLLKRAKSLVTKDFIEILNDLTPTGIEQANLIFGLQDDNCSDDSYS